MCFLLIAGFIHSLQALIKIPETFKFEIMPLIISVLGLKFILFTVDFVS